MRVVYILISEHWDDTEILGVYDSLEAAMGSDHPERWRRNGHGASMIGLPSGFATFIEQHVVKSA